MNKRCLKGIKDFYNDTAMIFNDLENFENKIITKYSREELDNLYNKIYH